MDELHATERALAELSMRLHWLAGRCTDKAVAHRIRAIADVLSDEAMELREVWASQFGELQ